MSPLFLRVARPGGMEVLEFHGTSINIGRDPLSDLLLDHPSVSERHARITVRDELVILVDLASETGTFIDERKITSPFVLREPHAIRMGVYTVEVHERPPPGDDESRLLQAIQARPGDDDSHAVYGDWLEENGRAREADFVRTQLTLRNVLPDDPRFQELSDRLAKLACLTTLHWRRALARPPIEQCPVRFVFVCPKQWDALAPTESPSERFCDACNKLVYYAATVFEAQTHASALRCVAVDIAQPRSPGDLFPRPPPRAGMLEPPPEPPDDAD